MTCQWCPRTLYREEEAAKTCAPCYVAATLRMHSLWTLGGIGRIARWY